jgi:hypothetical protein
MNKSSKINKERPVTPVVSFLRYYHGLQLAQLVEPLAVEYIAPAMAGDVDAAESLSCIVGNSKRGLMVVAFWKAKASVAAFRALLINVWTHNHQELIVAAQTRRRLRALFRYAQIELPPLPEFVRVWRGTCGLPVAHAMKGYSWTTDRDTACWFAMRFANLYGSPLVLAADVSRESIAFYNNDMSEHEVLLLNQPRNILIDGNQDDWHERQTALCAKRKSEMDADLKGLSLSKTQGEAVLA